MSDGYITSHMTDDGWSVDRTYGPVELAKSLSEGDWKDYFVRWQHDGVEVWFEKGERLDGGPTWRPSGPVRYTVGMGG